jgi:serine/threonine protein phosphatase 1
MFTISANTASVPPGERVYAVGDIHGRLDLLDRLLDMIAEYETARPCANSSVIFLGDYIDRGANSREVIERLLQGIPGGLTAHFLRGNHEAIMLRCLEGPALFGNWAANGGLATLRSYGVHASFAADARTVLGELRHVLPEAHLGFLRGLKMTMEVGDYFFVHAGVRPGVPLANQAEEDCLFIREKFLKHRDSFGKIVVHGHTPVSEPEVFENRIGIDTGSFFSGRLTALRLEGTGRAFLTAEGEGHWRER